MAQLIFYGGVILIGYLVFLIIAPVSALAGAFIVAGEFVVHYHVDWTKERVTKGNGLTPQTPGFWHALGVLLHDVAKRECQRRDGEKSERRSTSRRASAKASGRRSRRCASLMSTPSTPGLRPVSPCIDPLVPSGA